MTNQQTISRRAALVSAAALAVASQAAGAPARAPASPFVTVDRTSFRVGGAPYRFAGANLWSGAYLGADAPFGNRARLMHELDALAALGVTNVRVLGASEKSPLKNSLDPAFHASDGIRNEALFGGLDFLLAEMAKRNMRAVIYLSNFWEWSGGFVAYLSWTNGGRYIDMGDPAHPWPEFPDFSARFYASAPAVARYRDHVSALVTRTNTVSGVAYRDDPTIMAWQIANEPRPGGSEAAGRANLPAFYAFIGATAKFIKSLDANHLVSTGNEGLKGCMESDACVLTAHRIPEIDYMTCHIWPQNWGWADPKNLATTYARAIEQSEQYLIVHTKFASALDKPLVAEEFGFPRDGADFDPGSPTTLRDRFYALIYSHVMQSAKSGGPLAGTNFWAWGGAGRARHPDHRMQSGDTSFVGDPPHEPQGWYSVFDHDASTTAVIRNHAAALLAI